MSDPRDTGAYRAAVHGLIQHSFSFRLPKRRRPLADAGNLQQIRELFALPATDGGADFDVRAVGEHSPGDERRAARIAEHSPLVEFEKTTVHPLSLKFSGADGSWRDPTLPPAFSWAKAATHPTDSLQDGPTFVFGSINPLTRKVECNDFLVEGSECPDEARSISWSLLEILAHKRSRLLGLALANRIISVMLPHAILTQVGGPGSSTSGEYDQSWFVQPLLSFIRDGQVKTEFRESYSLTLLLVPITACGYGDRKMTSQEIDWTVNAGWGLAAVPTREKPPWFRARGPLPGYLSRLTPFNPTAAGADGEPFTLRQGTEVLAFSLALKLGQGSTDHTSEGTTRRLGDDVVTSLGSARVSSVLVVDDELTVGDIRSEAVNPLKRHRDLMAEISRETRPPRKYGFGKFGLDRPFVDDNTYVVGVVPTRRCIVVSCAAEAQHGWYQSGLMQAGSITHMTIGAATATGTLCAIDRDLEELESVKPNKIAEIDGEIATDLREIYDLDITSEAYRRLYRLLRKRLGIIRDYEALEEKMMALYRATSTKHEVKTQRRLNQMTAAIAALTVVLIVLTAALLVIEAHK